MVTAVFTDNDDYARTYGLWQWDYGQQLRIEGLHLPTAVEIHFALQETGGEAIPRVGTTKDGVTTVTIPDSMLEGNSTVWTADKAYNIYAWVYLSDKSSGETIKRITMQVKSRPKPEAFEAPGDGEIFREAIEAVNDAAKRAEEAGGKAVVAADEAKAAATQTAEHLQATEGLAEQVETNADTVAQDKQAVAGMLSQTQQAASDAALSAQAAKLSETAAVQAQAGAEAAEDGARQYAEDTGADRQAVANDKQVVSQMREAVAADRKAVEQTTTQFGQTAQDALTAIGQAQSTAVGAVEAEGQKQTTAVQEAGTQVVSEVTEAKTEAVQSVTAEGDKQAKRVEDAAAGIVADREQIAANKAGIEALSQKKADAIIETAQGDTMTLTDSSDKLFEGLRVFGKSTQVKTTGAQLFDVTDVEMKAVLKMDGTTSSNGNIHTSGFIKVLPNETYSVSSARQNRGKFYDINKRVLTTDKFDFELANSKDKFTTSEKTEYVRFSIYETESLDNVMVNAGDTLKPWEPYTGGKPSPSPEYPQEIVSAGEGGSVEVDVRGKNLLPFPYADGMTKTTNGITFTVNTDRSITCTGTAINQAFFNLNRQKYTENPTDFNKYYSAVDCGYDHSNNITYISVSKSEGYINKTIYPMVVKKGETNLEYEPPRIPQSLTLATPNGLPGIPVTKDGNYTDADGQQWICDEIDLGRGKYVQRIEEHILKSKNITSITNSRQINSEYYGIEYNGCTKDFVGKFGNGVLCDKLAFVKPNSNINGHEITYVPGNGIIVFGLKKSLVPSGDLDEIRNYITSNNFAFLILIDSPIEKDLTPEEITEYKKTHTNYPTTVITNDAGAHMEVAYVADTKNYIHNLEERLNAKLVNIQSALISQKISGGCGGGGIKVTDSSRVPVVRFAMWGKTEQVRTSGKNLFDISSLKKYEINNNNLKASVVDGKIILEGKGVTTTEVIFFCLNKTDDLLKLNPGKYTLSFKSNMPMGTANESKTVEAFAIIKKADGSSDYSSTGNKEWTTFDIAEGDMIYLRFDINNGTMSAEFYDIQLEYGSSATAYEPYSGNFPSPSPDWEQPIEITDQPVTVTVKGGTEQQSITLSPPKPMTKWDKLEKVDGVWCWVYQSRWVESYTDENITGEYISTTGELNAGAEVYCKADTSESIPLSPSEQAQLNALMMYAPETEITNTGGCNMELTYTVDTKSYIDKKIAEISTAVLEV